jgi:multiple sugar transport system permease protein
MLNLEVIVRWVLAIFFLVIAIFPIYWLFNVVFSPPGTAVAITPRLFPTSFSDGMVKIQQILAKGPFLKATMTSFVYAYFQIAGMLLVTSLAAYEFSLFDFPGKNVLFTLALTGMMVPLAVTIIPMFRVVVALKWVNTMAGLAVPGMASALSLFIIKQLMEDIPRELIEAAEIDGASHFRIYWNIVLPQSINALLTVSILTFVYVWGSFLWPLIVSNKPDGYTISVLVASLSGTTAYTPIDQLVAAYFLAAIPPVLVYIFLQRFIVDSVARSGIKG